jgi:hypothetical protein
MTLPARARYSGYRFPAEIIGHATVLGARGGVIPTPNEDVNVISRGPAYGLNARVSSSR